MIANNTRVVNGAWAEAVLQHVRHCDECCYDGVAAPAERRNFQRSNSATSAVTRPRGLQHNRHATQEGVLHGIPPFTPTPEKGGKVARAHFWGYGVVQFAH